MVGSLYKLSLSPHRNAHKQWKKHGSKQQDQRAMVASASASQAAPISLHPLSMEDDKDARWFGVEDMMESKKEGKGKEEDDNLLVTHRGWLGCHRGRCGGLPPWSSSS